MIAVLVLLAACGRPSPSAEGSADAIFPHSAEFVASHGVEYAASRDSCLPCHSPKAEESSAGPACTTCHAAYPHDEGLHAGTVHGPLWQADATACSGCHGIAGDRVPAGASPGSCVGCHSPYPHDTAWKQAAQHGASVVAHGGPEACAGCHGSAGSASATALCGECHAAYPHVAGWAAPSAHGAAFLADAAACGTCHDGSDPTKVPGCAQCHDVFPHAEGWTTAHIPIVQARGDGACLGCHPALQGPRIPNTCAASCHGGGS